MEEMLVAAIEAQVEDHAGAGGLVAPALLEAARGRRAGQELAVSPHGIAVGDHGRQGHLRRRRRARRPRSSRPASVRIVWTPTPAVRARRRARRPAGPAPRRRRAVPPRGYQTPSAVCMWAMPQRTAGERSGDGADVLGEVVEHLGDPRVGHVAADRRPDGAPGPHREHVAQRREAHRGGRVEHVAERADRPPEEIAPGDVVEPLGQVEELAIALARGPAGGERVERLGHPRRHRREGRGSSRPSKNDRHCGSSGISSSSSFRSRPASAKIRRRTDGISRMVGPMSNRKPSSESTAALPPSQAFFSNSTTS